MKFVAILVIFSILFENSFGQEEKTKEQRKAEKEARQKEKERTEFNHLSKIILTRRLQGASNWMQTQIFDDIRALRNLVFFKIVVSIFLYCFLNFWFLIGWRHFWNSQEILIFQNIKTRKIGFKKLHSFCCRLKSRYWIWLQPPG